MSVADEATVYYLPGTSGWGETFSGLPTVLWNPHLQAYPASHGELSIGITGTLQIPIVMEVCTNLVNPVWVPVWTNTVGQGLLFEAVDWTNFPTRYYRIRSP